MGRGRQKAKHTKVARELKYYSPETNYHALEQELKAGQSTDVVTEDRWNDGASSEYDNTYSPWDDDRR